MQLYTIFYYNITNFLAETSLLHMIKVLHCIIAALNRIANNKYRTDDGVCDKEAIYGRFRREE